MCRRSVPSHLRLERAGSFGRHGPLLAPPPPSTVLVHLHGHEATTLASGVLNFLFATPVGAAITDEAGQESNESGESHADQ